MTPNKLLIYPFLLFFLSSTVAQQNDGGSAPSSFTPQPNDIGALRNSVNLYTGQVSFPMALASLPGRGGLNPQLSINYSSSGVKQAVEMWNREVPTGVLGLGWSLSFPKIVSDHKFTGTRHDDSFYIVDAGASYELVCTDDDDLSTAGYRTYETKNYQPWLIKYYYNEEKWEIIRENGSSFIYGDNTRPREDGTIQYMIKWGNWIGDSEVVTGQEEHAYVWNLSEVQNLWGDELVYSYENVEEEVGTHGNPGAPANPRHTKASYLKRITGPAGNFLELTYNDKVYEPCALPSDFRCTGARREYQDTKTRQSEPDAYQEKFEDKYLAGVNAFNEDAMPLYTVDLLYDETLENQWIGDGEFVKRTLTGIQHTNATGAQLPKTEFEYFQEDDEFKGYLRRVKNSIGGEISYSYKTTGEKTGRICVINGSCQDIITSKVGVRDLEITTPFDNYREPEIHTGPDYVVVIWRRQIQTGPSVPIYFPTTEPSPTIVELYQWEGEWVKYDLGSIGDRRMSDESERHEWVVTLQSDFFGIGYRLSEDRYKVDLYHKNETEGGWETFEDDNVLLEDGRLATAQYLTELSFFSGPDHVAFGNLTTERLYTYTWRGGSWQKNLINYSSTPAGYLHTGSGNFIITHNTAPNPDIFWFRYLSEDGNWTGKVFPGNFDVSRVLSVKDKDPTFWYSGPSYALVMADGNPEFIFQWDEFYNTINRTEIEATGDHYPVYVRSNDLFGIMKYDEDQWEDDNFITLYRYNGINWARNGVSTKRARSSIDILGRSSGGSKLQLGFYDADLGRAWPYNEFTVSESRFDRYIEVLPNMAMMGTKLYYLEPDGNWLEMGEISTINHTGDSWKYDLRASGSTFFSAQPYDKTHLYHIKNGRIHLNGRINYSVDKRLKYYPAHEGILGHDIFAAFPTSSKYLANKARLFKWSDGKNTAGHQSVIVRSITINDGTLNVVKSFDYNLETARMETLGRFPLFNEVTEVQGSNDPGIRPRGYTTYYFYNGKAFSDLAKVPADQAVQGKRLLTGSPYRTELYDAQNNKLTESETVFNYFSKNIVNSGAQNVEVARYVRPAISRAWDYRSTGTQSTLIKTTFNQYGLPIVTETYNNEIQSEATLRQQTTYQYYPEVYGATGHHLISEVVGTTARRNLTLISASATVWTDINSVPQAIKSYSWLGTGSGTFTGYDGSDPGSEWRLAREIEQRDDKGNVLTSSNFRDEDQAMIYDDLQRYPMATASYAHAGQIAFTSFEPHQSGGWTFAAGGLRENEGYTGKYAFFQSLVQGPSLPAGSYVLEYWYRNGSTNVTVTGGSTASNANVFSNRGWTLQRVEVTLNTTGNVSLNATGYLDEVRIYPQGAYMSTSVYNEKNQKTAETGVDMISTYLYYDDLDRQHYVADHEGNIVMHYEYGFKGLND